MDIAYSDLRLPLVAASYEEVKSIIQQPLKSEYRIRLRPATKAEGVISRFRPLRTANQRFLANWGDVYEFHLMDASFFVRLQISDSHEGYVVFRYAHRGWGERPPFDLLEVKVIGQDLRSAIVDGEGTWHVLYSLTEKGRDDGDENNEGTGCDDESFTFLNKQLLERIGKLIGLPTTSSQEEHRDDEVLVSPSEVAHLLVWFGRTLAARVPDKRLLRKYVDLQSFYAPLIHPDY